MEMGDDKRGTPRQTLSFDIVKDNLDLIIKCLMYLIRQLMNTQSKILCILTATVITRHQGEKKMNIDKPIISKLAEDVCLTEKIGCLNPRRIIREMETIDFIGIFVSSKRYVSVQKCYPSHHPSVDTSDTRSPFPSLDQTKRKFLSKTP